MKIAIIDKNPRTQFRVGNNWPIWPINSDLQRKVRVHKPDWLFISSKIGAHVVRDALKGTPTRSVYFYGDFRLEPPHHVVEFCGMTDMALFTFKHPAYWSLSPSPHVVRLGTNPEFFYRMPEVAKEFDVAFGGNYHAGNIRPDTLRFLDRHYRLLVIGRSWNGMGFKNWIGRKNLIKINRHFNRACVTVGIHNMNRHDGSIGTSYYTSNRLFQNMCVGVPHIAPYSPGVEEYFTSGYIDFRDHGELRKKIDWLLSLPQEARDAIGEIQREQIVNNHTHAHSWRYMESIIDGYDRGDK